jgi:hypothetical protein
VPSEPSSLSRDLPGGSPPPGPAEEVGDPACWAALACPECGAILSEGHLAWCTFEALAAPPAALAPRDEK